MSQAVSCSRPMTGGSSPWRGERRQVAADLVEQRRARRPPPRRGRAGPPASDCGAGAGGGTDRRGRGPRTAVGASAVRRRHPARPRRRRRGAPSRSASAIEALAAARRGTSRSGGRATAIAPGRAMPGIGRRPASSVDSLALGDALRGPRCDRLGRRRPASAARGSARLGRGAWHRSWSELTVANRSARNRPLASSRSESWRAMSSATSCILLSIRSSWSSRTSCGVRPPATRAARRTAAAAPGRREGRPAGSQRGLADQVDVRVGPSCGPRPRPQRDQDRVPDAARPSRTCRRRPAPDRRQRAGRDPPGSRRVRAPHRAEVEAGSARDEQDSRSRRARRRSAARSGPPTSPAKYSAEARRARARSRRCSAASTGRARAGATVRSLVAADLLEDRRRATSDVASNSRPPVRSATPCIASLLASPNRTGRCGPSRTGVGRPVVVACERGPASTPALFSPSVISTIEYSRFGSVACSLGDDPRRPARGAE